MDIGQMMKERYIDYGIFCLIAFLKTSILTNRTVGLLPILMPIVTVPFAGQ
jgi:hypothetical protein